MTKYIRSVVLTLLTLFSALAAQAQCPSAAATEIIEFGETCLDADDGIIAIKFNDGPSPIDTSQITLLDILNPGFKPTLTFFSPDSLVFSDLPPSSNYFLFCEATVPSTTLEFPIIIPASSRTEPNVPTTVAATDVDCDNFVAQWDAVADVEEYFVDLSLQSDFSSFVVEFRCDRYILCATA